MGDHHSVVYCRSTTPKRRMGLTRASGLKLFFFMVKEVAIGMTLTGPSGEATRVSDTGAPDQDADQDVGSSAPLVSVRHRFGTIGAKPLKRPKYNITIWIHVSAGSQLNEIVGLPRCVVCRVHYIFTTSIMPDIRI